MFGINYNGLKKRNTYDEIVNVIETDKTQIKYPDRRATRYLNDPHVLAITSAPDLEMNEQQENMTKNVIIENAIRQMSGATNTHNVYNTYVHTPQQETAASADVGMNDGFDSEAKKWKMRYAHTEKEKRLKHSKMRKLFVSVLKLQHNIHKQKKRRTHTCKIIIYHQNTHNHHHHHPRK